MKKEMLINVLQPEECRIAIVEDGVLEELYVERTSHESYTGNIYKGKVVNLEPAIQAAFVDFSVGRNGFLHVSDVEPQYYHRIESEEDERPARERSVDRSARERSSDRPARDRGPEREPRPERGPASEREPRPERGSASGRERGRDRQADRDALPPPRRTFGENLIDPPSPSRSEERYRERDRGPERERPDLSLRGRKDRTEPVRRFGEGLGFEDNSTQRPIVPELPDPFAEPMHPSEPPASTFQRETPKRESERVEIPSWREDQETEADRRDTSRDDVIGWGGADRGREHEEKLVSEEFRARQSPDDEPFDPDLPPSRTHRGRGSRPAEPDAEAFVRSRSASLSPDPWARTTEEASEPPATPSRDPRRGRGRGRSAPPPRAAVPAAEAEDFPVDDYDQNAEAESNRAASFASDDAPPEVAPRPRSGRAAIRSRGGDRQRPGGEAERPRNRDIERPRPEPTEPQSRERERPRPSNRAGEPGYVPRRDRERLREESSYAEPPSYSAAESDWSNPLEDLDLLEAGHDVESDVASDEGGDSEGAKGEGRRRRRRRGRRRDRERPASEAKPSSSPEDFGDDFGDVKPEAPKSRSRRSEYRPSRPVEDVGDALSDIDFHDADAELGRDLIEDDDDLEFAERRSEIRDEPIDPELEQEIRREIEEIEVLEREMGLRGPSEARPRRGDDAPPRGRAAGAAASRGRGMIKPPIQEIFRRGDEVLVQVIKESIGTKGPTLSTYISIPGRYLVLMPGLSRVGVSRKIVDEGQRRKLREIMHELNPPKNLGFIVRTAGLERTKRELAKDLAYLLRLWKVILRRIKKTKGPTPIYQESDMIIRTIRDIFTSDIDTIWIDEPAAFERAQEFLRVVMPRYVNRIKLHEEKVPLFHKYGIEDEIAKIQRRHVPLPEGGSIVIDQTEALVAIDVNSGNFRVEDDAERTAYEMNLRAAKEIGRQLRLRDLGGVIVNDFIDMKEERHRRGVERAIRDAVRRDRARTKILRMSQFGLIEMTRQRIRPSLKRSVYEDCTHCTGAGVVKTVESMAIDVMRILGLASNREDIRRVQITVNPNVATYLNNRKRKEISKIESECQMSIHIGVKENSPAEHLHIECYDTNNSEIRLMPLTVTGHRRGH